MRFRYIVMAALLAAAAIVARPLLSDAAEQDAAFSKDQKAAIETIVHDYLLANPSILKDMSQAMQATEMKSMMENATKAIAENKDALFNDKDLPFIGAADGDVVMVQFYDYQCHYCKMALETVQTLIKADPKLKVVLVDFPILSEDSNTASAAAIASAKQGKYADFYPAVMGYQGRLDKATIEKLAASAGVDVEQMKKDMESAEVKERIARNHELGGKIGIRGTPGFVVGAKLLPGVAPVEEFKKMIAEVRAANAGK